MKKLFIDCGFHHGEGLKTFANMLGFAYDAGRQWDIFCFEPNPECKIIERVESINLHSLYPVIKPSIAAVWIHAGYVEFSQENHFTSESGSPTDGTSIRDGWASQITSLNGQCSGLEKPIQVPCIDFSKWLGMLQNCYTVYNEIYVKMDIEGAEFPVLRKMLADDTVKRVKKLWVEFHDRFIPGETPQTRDTLIKELSKHTEVNQWH